MKFKFKLGFIGFGNMATAILGGVIDSKLVEKEGIVIYDKFDGAREKAINMGINIAENNIELVKNCEYVVFAIKPQGFAELAEEIKDYMDNKKVLSILAGTTIATYNSYFPTAKVARAMPNTPALVKNGMAGVDVRAMDNEGREFILSLFKSIGDVIEIEESQINDVIGISGSGPAYVYMFIKGMYEKALKLGFDEDTAKKLVVNTVRGSATMFEKSTDDIDTLTQRVCSKGGTTIEAVKVFQNDGLVEMIDKAIQACYDRAEEMSRGE